MHSKLTGLSATRGAATTQAAAGVHGQHVLLGVAVFFGMIGVTFFGIFLTPVFYTIIRNLTGNKPITAPGERADPDANPQATPVD